jgi:hypothetical protein
MEETPCAPLQLCTEASDLTYNRTDPWGRTLTDAIPVYRSYDLSAEREVVSWKLKTAVGGETVWLTIYND